MRQDVFSVAFQEAKSELLDITCRFEALRQRKERLDSVVAVLGPLLETRGTAPVARPIEPVAAEAAEPVRENPIQFNKIETVEDKEEEITDPLQRRLREALRFNTPSRDELLKAI
ncbi:MAG: hypothetical protein P4L40_23775 [Terracidiphilus sp.]|nr:hypothetical protein [Terracidiphilus sp.]